MLLEKLFEHLALKVHPFATCMVAEGWRLLLPDPVHVTLHYILEGEGKLRVGSGEFLPLPTNAIAIMPPGIEHAIQCGTPWITKPESRVRETLRQRCANLLTGS